MMDSRSASASARVIGGGSLGSSLWRRAFSMSSYFQAMYLRPSLISSQASGPSQAKTGRCTLIVKSPVRPAESNPCRAIATCSASIAGLTSVAMNPSAILPARRTAGSLAAPIHSGGPPGCAGSGRTATAGPSCSGPPGASSPRQARRIVSMLATSLGTRSDSGTPKPSNSSSRQPSPRPRISRPPEIRSVTAASSASRSGSCSGASTTPVPIRTCSVRAAIAAQSGSIAGR